jgi:hypothetical protein
LPVGTVIRPVPPLVTGKAVPDKETAKFPLVVIGDPVTDKNVGTVMPTEVTVPEPPPPPPVAPRVETVFKTMLHPVAWSNVHNRTTAAGYPTEVSVRSKRQYLVCA